MKSITNFICFAILSAVISANLPAQTGEGAVTLRYTGGSTYYLVERSNWSKYINGAYVGLTHRETRANINAVPGGTGETKFSGFFYILEETLRDMTRAARGLDETREASFTVSGDGRMRFIKDPGYPALREFPVYPENSVYPGDRWQAEGKRVIDPRNDGKKTTLPIMVEYEFVGSEVYRDRAVNRLRAKYATRINKYLKSKSDDPDLKDATGTHDVEILVDSETGSTVLILDRLDETFFYQDGSSIRFKGNTALFTEFPVLVDHGALVPKIASLAEKAGNAAASKAESGGVKKSAPPRDDTFDGSAVAKNDGVANAGTAVRPSSDAGKQKPATPQVPDTAVAPSTVATPSITAQSGKDAESKPFTVEETPQGIRLSVRDIRFMPDSDAILPEEAWRLDTIAETLKLVPGGRFLIEGHTASVGKPEGEKTLSVARAKKIADELVQRGLLAEQFIYAGYGGTKPVADNKTAAGRAQNRRVEITIME